MNFQVCDPHQCSSRQSNGVRNKYPLKGTDLSAFFQEKIGAITNSLNSGPISRVASKPHWRHLLIGLP